MFNSVLVGQISVKLDCQQLNDMLESAFAVYADVHFRCMSLYDANDSIALW